MYFFLRWLSASRKGNRSAEGAVKSPAFHCLLTTFKRSWQHRWQSWKAAVKLKWSEVVPRFMTMRKLSKPVASHWDIQVADFIPSHHVLASGEMLAEGRQPRGVMLLLLPSDGRCADAAVRRARSSSTKKHQCIGIWKSPWICEGEDKF